MQAPVFERIAIIGAGLIGASIALSVAETGAAATVALFDSDPDVRARARHLGLGDVTETAAEACARAECVILCVPVGALGAAARDCAGALAPGTIITDTGSVKARAAAALREALPENVHLVPGHPIAGTEQSGPEAGFASVFQDAWHILTPIDTPDPVYPDAVKRLTAFWGRLGARVERMDAARHDRVLAITSHLPHLIAYNIVCTAHDMESVDEGDVVKYSAGGFRDFTRIAASDPVMWRDVFLNNREAVLECLGRFSEDLAALQRAIRWGDGEALMREFTRARGVRKAIIDAGRPAPHRYRFQRRAPRRHRWEQ